MNIIKVGYNDWEIDVKFSILITADNNEDLKYAFLKNIESEFNKALKECNNGV